MKKRTITIIVIFLLILLIYLSSYPFGLEERKYNIFLITIDGLRADHLHCYGYKINTGANICSLAKDGVLFKNAFSQATYTSQSLPSLMTSKFITELVERTETLSPDELTILDVLRENNYEIGVFSDNPHLELMLKVGKKIDVLPEKELYNFTPKYHRTFFWLHSNRMKYYGRSIAKNYDSGIELEDENIKNIFKKLSDLGLYNESLIIISADHGEGLGEHGIMEHAGEPYDEQIHVPLIIKFPHNKYSGTIIENQVRLVDIVPTILDVLGEKNYIEVQGTSLVPIVDGRNSSLIVYSYGPTLDSLRSEEYKYMASRLGQEEKLFDLKNDPEEKYNVASERIEVTSKFRNMLIKLLNESSGNLKTISTTLTEDIIERLKDFGYIV